MTDDGTNGHHPMCQCVSCAEAWYVEEAERKRKEQAERDRAR